jgi:tetratricopeptide (TPR) repeat protein
LSPLISSGCKDKPNNVRRAFPFSVKNMSFIISFSTIFYFTFLYVSIVFVRGGEQPEASPWPKEEISYEKYVQSVKIFNQAVQHQSTDPKRAKELYLQSTVINPFLAEAYLNLGMLAATTEEVKEMYLKAAHAASNGRNNQLYSDAMGNLGHHLVEDSGLGHDYYIVEEALQYYREGLRVSPNHLSSLYNSGIAYEKQGKRQEAFDMYRRVMKEDSLHIGANLNAGNLCMYAGLHNLSLTFHSRALEGYTQRGNDPW